ncbi:AraC family transcriptional regulator [Paraflavitalea sp. CAU 1676]|uniref:helix-turn-helix transcriptional regulator n=1 Tax=Paraflavitalea sp. CAU 1676 TaxID=3032598 RepID=UPI0023DB21F5|nr:AraC family transcriptional regulator [Paraflavitalea sp. CAU 1676]MDF2189529.1 AraC family transcriptional regulator [Paraflavitalea sp. CAU 1676]
MDIQLMLRDNEPVSFSKTVPGPLARLQVPGAMPQYASGEWGNFLFYEQTGPDFSIWYKTYQMKQSICLHAVTEAPMYSLCFAINRSFRFQQEGMSKTRLAEGEFNILYGASLHHQLWLEKGKKYTVCEIQFAPAWLHRLGGSYSLVDEFLFKTSLGFSGQLNPVHAAITPDILTILQHMRNCPFTGDAKNTWLQSLLSRLLLLTVTKMSMSSQTAAGWKLQAHELAKVREAREYLSQRIDQPGTVMELSHTIGLNDFKLKRRFKQMYGVTIFEFLLEARMEKAKGLLLETNMTVHAVAISVGYKNISSFTVAFKKKYGVLPSTMQRSGTDQ